MNEWWNIQKNKKGEILVEFEQEGEVAFWTDKGDQIEITGTMNVVLTKKEIVQLYEAIQKEEKK